MALTLLTKSTGVIKAFHDVALYHEFRGPNNEIDHRGGVFKDIGDELSLTTSNATKTATIGTGMALLYGRQFSLSTTETLSFTALTGVNYVTIYIEINTYNVTDERISLKYEVSGGYYPVIKNENIYQKKTGIATLPLYQLMYNATTSTFSNVTPVHKLLVPGTDEETHELLASATINGRTVNNLLNPTNGKWYNATEAKSAEWATHLQKTKTPLAKGVVLDDLSLPGRGTKIMTASPPWIIEPTENFSDSGVSGLAWKPGVVYSHTRPLALKTNHHAGTLSHYIIDIKMSGAVWKIGFIGIGSRWEYIFQNKIASIVANPGETIYIEGAYLGQATQFGTVSENVYVSGGSQYSDPHGIFQIKMPISQFLPVEMRIRPDAMGGPGGFGQLTSLDRCRLFGTITIREIYIGGQA